MSMLNYEMTRIFLKVSLKTYIHKSIFIICIAGLSALPSMASEGINILVPSPLAVALTVGQWIMKDSQKTYYVQVEVTARTSSQAREDALRKAVDMAVGTLILTELEVRNHEVIKNDFLKYSSGYVNNFNVINENLVGDQVRMVIDVWVSESRIANRLISIGKGEGDVDGSKAAFLQDSIRRHNEEAAILIDKVASDYPKRAYDIQVSKSVTRVDGDNTEILVPTKITWNNSYINALIEVLERTRENGSNSSNSNWQSIIYYRSTDGWFNNFAAYRSEQPKKIIELRMIESSPYLMARFLDSERSILATDCNAIPTMNGGYYGKPLFWFQPSDSIVRPKSQFIARNTPFAHIGIYGDYDNIFNYRAFLPRSTSWLPYLKKIELSIVKKEDCRLG
jgi:hypothetical protein